MLFTTLLPYLSYGDGYFYLPSPALVIVDLLHVGCFGLEHEEPVVHADVGVWTMASSCAHQPVRVHLELEWDIGSQSCLQSTFAQPISLSKEMWVSSCFPARFPFFWFVVFLLFLRWREMKCQFECLLLTVI